MDVAAYAGLFIAAFAAATIAPFQSEFALGAMLLSGRYDVVLVITVASVGNTLGSVVNWMLGRGINRFRDRRWFPVKPEKLARFERSYHRYGKWSLLLSWAPFVGDPLTLVAGVLREPLLPFVVIVAFAKTARYVAVAAIALGWT